MSDAPPKKLVPLFIPKLVLLLEHAEQEKGQPLTEVEALEVRDHATVVMVGESMALDMAQSRGPDIDPTNVWEEWQTVRQQ